MTTKDGQEGHVEPEQPNAVDTEEGPAAKVDGETSSEEKTTREDTPGTPNKRGFRRWLKVVRLEPKLNVFTSFCPSPQLPALYSWDTKRQCCKTR